MKLSSPNDPTNNPAGRMNLPLRHKLPHAVPFWVPQNAVFYITINCIPHHQNHLAHPEIANTIHASLLHYQNMGKWWIRLFVLMPDHLHGLIVFSREQAVESVVGNWKRYLATHHQIHWQVNYHETRIRDRAMLIEKRDYIRANPVRQGLVQTPDDWSYQWHDGCSRQQSPETMW